MAGIFFLSSALFLGWSLGANDAANVFGSAVGSRMLRFRTATVIAAVFIIAGAGISGGGTSSTLDRLGGINQLAGAFTVSLCAGMTVFAMVRAMVPVSSSQAIIGAIVGWDLFAHVRVNPGELAEIVSTWVVSPLLAGVFAAVIYKLIKAVLNRMPIHLLKLDFMTRAGFIIIGAFGSYSLGANNVANVVGVFVSVSPFRTITGGCCTLSSADQLFILGGIAIAAGVVSYSIRVMKTVGSGIVKLSPLGALVVVLAVSLVLFIFSSQSLSGMLRSAGLPSLPLVPVSSSQAVIGAIIGIALLRGGRGVDFRLLGRIAAGWIATPVIAGMLTFISLFVFQNVFNMKVVSLDGPDAQKSELISRYYPESAAPQAHLLWLQYRSGIS